MNDPRSDPNSFTLAWTVPRGMLTASDRLAYWRQVGDIAAGLKDDELRRGLDKDGRKLRAITRYTRLHRRSAMGQASPDAPPLTPAFGLSRTRALLRWQAYLDRVVFYWAFDPHTAGPWGVILGYHRAGVPGRLPKRDVIGLSRGARQKARRDADAWWVSGGVAPPPEPPRGFQRPYIPRPVPLPRPAPPRPGPAPPRPIASPILKAAPIRPFKTGPLEFKGGKFVPVKILHGITPLTERTL